MTRVIKAASLVLALGAGAVATGYFVDVHRCQRLNYEELGAVVPNTFVLDLDQCFGLAGQIKMRGFARDISRIEPAAGRR